MPRGLKNHTLASQIASPAGDGSAAGASIETLFGQLAGHTLTEAPKRITREDASTAEYLMKRTVLFLADASHGTAPMIGDIYEGTVVSIDEAKRIVMVCYLYGYQSRTDDVKFDNLLAVLDKENGTELTVGRFSGPSIDLRIPKAA